VLCSAPGAHHAAAVLDGEPAVRADPVLRAFTSTHFRPSAWYMVPSELAQLLALSLLTTLADFDSASQQAGKLLTAWAAVGLLATAAAAAAPFPAAQWWKRAVYVAAKAYAAGVAAALCALGAARGDPGDPTPSATAITGVLYAGVVLLAALLLAAFVASVAAAAVARARAAMARRLSALQVAVVNLPFLNRAFGTAPLSLAQWWVCFAMASGVLWFSELRKWVQRTLAVAR
jgi:hypothetical protein